MGKRWHTTERHAGCPPLFRLTRCPVSALGMMNDRLQLIGGMLALCAVLAGCSASSVRAPVGERTPRAAPEAGVHVVQKGDSLFSVAWRHGLDYRAVAAWNGIRPPYTIHPGQRLRLHPPSVARKPTAPATVTRRIEPPRTTARPAPKTPAKSVPSPTSSVFAPPRWQWPAAGPLLRKFDGSTSGKKGIAIGGSAGSAVRAAAAGQVVYAGSGLVGYGRLIIVKHNDTYLSAYGHNRNLLVKEGDEVRAGQTIAQMGSSGTNRIQLHFEIRQNGKPVDPLRYLPRR